MTIKSSAIEITSSISVNPCRRAAPTDRSNLLAPAGEEPVKGADKQPG